MHFLLWSNLTNFIYHMPCYFPDVKFWIHLIFLLWISFFQIFTFSQVHSILGESSIAIYSNVTFPSSECLELFIWPFKKILMPLKTWQNICLDACLAPKAGSASNTAVCYLHLFSNHCRHPVSYNIMCSNRHYWIHYPSIHPGIWWAWCWILVFISVAVQPWVIYLVSLCFFIKNMEMGNWEK